MPVKDPVAKVFQVWESNSSRLSFHTKVSCISAKRFWQTNLKIQNNGAIV